jgi:esterase/lipase superfamily enzyme
MSGYFWACSRIAFALVTILCLAAAPALADVNEINGLSQRAKELAQAGNLSEAIPLAEQAVGMARTQLEAKSPLLAVCLNRLAGLYRDAGRYDEAERNYKEAIEIRRSVDPDQYPDSLNDLGLLYWDISRYGEAEQLFKQVVGLYREKLGPNHEYVATAATNLGLLYRDMGRYEDAENVMLQGKTIREKLTTSTRDEDIANSDSNLAGLYRDMGRPAEAEPLARKALALREKLFGRDHPVVASSMNVLAEIQRVRGHSDEAEELLNSALAIRKKAFGADNLRVATNLNSLGAVYESQGKLSAAEKAYKAALAIRERQLKPRFPFHPDLATSQANLGALYKAQMRYSEAEPLLRSALAIREKTLGPAHPDYLKTLMLLGDLLRAQGRQGDADPLFDRAQSIRRTAIRQVNVLFGTNRKQVAQAKTFEFGSARSERVSFGVASVWVPTELNPPAPALETSPEARGALRAPRDETTDSAHLIIRGKAPLSEPDLVQQANKTLGEARNYQSQALIFVHGFNVSFENAVKRTAQIAYDLDFDGPVFLFTWPSRGGNTLISNIIHVFDYTADSKSADASVDDLRIFLENIARQVGAQKLHVLAHSMGNKILLDALKDSALKQELPQLHLGEVVLASPDVDRVLFGQRTGKLEGLAAKLTLYASRSDKALIASQFFWKSAPAGYVEEGKTPVLAKNVESIDITAAGDNFFGLNHDVFATNPQITRDIRMIFERDKHPPDARGQDFQSKAAAQGEYWLYTVAPAKQAKLP